MPEQPTSFFGPIYDTPSKRAFGQPQGVDRLAEICGTLQIPVIAIGGVTQDNAAALLKAGAAGVAAIRLFQESKGMESLRETLRTDASTAGLLASRRLRAKPAPDRLQPFNVITDHLKNSHNRNCQNKPHGAPQPSPKKQRDGKSQRVETHAPPN